MKPSLASPVPPAGSPTLGRLRSVSAERGVSALEGELATLQALLADDLSSLEQDVHRFLQRDSREIGPVERSASHLLSLGGKRLRPMCVMLASRVGGDFSHRARQLAVAVELVHSATLLHDDVVDLGTSRRGAPASRELFGNAASIYAGDWLLVEALRRVRGTGLDDVLTRLLDVIEEMILAESLQLQARGKLTTTRHTWLAVVKGKTASLFRWAMFAGGRAADLTEAQCQALERFGAHMGTAFQARDDLLDLQGDQQLTGKALFSDLREGKMTWPVIVAAEREPELMPLLQQICTDSANGSQGAHRALEMIKRTGALEDGLRFARGESELAAESLNGFPDVPAVRHLRTVAESAVKREQ